MQGSFSVPAALGGVCRLEHKDARVSAKRLVEVSPSSVDAGAQVTVCNDKLLMCHDISVDARAQER